MSHSFICPEFSRFSPQKFRFPRVFHNFNNFSNSLSFPGFSCFPGLWPPCRKNRGFLRSSDVWDSYDQCEHSIPDIPDGRRFLRRDRKNRKHFYFEGTVPDGLDVGDFYDECEHEIYLSGTVADDRGFLRWVWTWNLPVLDIRDVWFCLYLLPKLHFQWIINV